MRVTVHTDGGPIKGGAIGLGGHQSYKVSHLLAHDGRDPALGDNGMSEDTYGTNWILARTKQLIALYDHPLYSFMAGVEALTNESTRTTTAVGIDAVEELYATRRGGAVRGRFYAPMPPTMRDEQRRASETRYLPKERIGGGYREPTAKRTAVVSTATGPDGFPVVGRIGAGTESLPEESENDDALSSGMDLMRKGAAEASAAAAAVDRTRSYHAAEGVSSGHSFSKVYTSDDNPVPPGDALAFRAVGTAADLQESPVVPNAKVVPATDEADAARGLVEGPVVDPLANVETTNGTFAYDLENGERTLLSRLNGTTPLSPSDLDAWRILYTDGAGVTKPIPRFDPSQLDSTRQAQRRQIDRHVASAPEDLHWRLLPENLRVLFLTERARCALEHAAWFAEFQQPSDPHLPAVLQTPNAVFSSDRQRVPLIDLITHKHVRVPFQALVANIILYWKHRRLADARQMENDLAAINQVMMTLRTMREETNGFVSLMGHYEVEAQKSRADTADARVSYLARTGNYYSDMDRDFYSRAVRPGSHVGRLLASSARSTSGGSLTLAQDVALANAMRAAGPSAGHYDVARDARARYAMTAMVFSGLNT